jgi:hypothetical protein
VGIGGAGGNANGAGAGAAAAGGGSATGCSNLEMSLVNSPGPELTGGAAGTAGGAGVGSAGVWASLWISRVTPPGVTSGGSGEISGVGRELGSGL